MLSKRAERLAVLNAAREELERAFLRAANPQWTARFEERKADEAKVRRKVRALLQKGRKALGSGTQLARLGRGLWEAVHNDRSRRQQVKEVLAAEVRRRVERTIRDSDIREAVAPFVDVARRSQISILTVIGAMKKQVVPGWTPADVVFTEGVAENIDEVAGMLENAVMEGYARDVAAIIVEATDPAKPLPIRDVAKRISNELIGITGKRATVIARTETARVYGRNALEAMKRNGLPRRRWLTAAGSPAALRTPVCDYCQALAAAGWVDVNEPISAELMVGVREPKLVRATAEHPPYHPNCRCDIAADTEGWLPSAPVV